MERTGIRTPIRLMPDGGSTESPYTGSIRFDRLQQSNANAGFAGVPGSPDLSTGAIGRIDASAREA